MSKPNLKTLMPVQWEEGERRAEGETRAEGERGAQ